MDELQQFLTEKINNQSETSINVYEKFYNRMISYFPEDKRPIDFSKDDFMKILSNMNSKAVGNFTVVKSNIRDYILWMVQQGFMSNEQLEIFTGIQYDDVDHSNQYLLYYFKNFDELYSVLEQTIECHLGDNEDEGEFDTLRCTIYLSWFGFTLDEIVNVMKSDISNVESIIYKGKEKVPIHIGEKCMSYIYDYRDRESFRSRKFGRVDGVEMRYKDSKYLFRSCKSGHLTEQQLTAMTRYTNPYVDEVGKRFAFGKILQSGIYYRIYLDEQENGILKKDEYTRMARLFGLSENDLNIKAKKYDLSSRKFLQYQEYKKAFYN